MLQPRRYSYKSQNGMHILTYSLSIYSEHCRVPETSQFTICYAPTGYVEVVLNCLFIFSKSYKIMDCVYANSFVFNFKTDGGLQLCISFSNFFSSILCFTIFLLHISAVVWCYDDTTIIKKFLMHVNCCSFTMIAEVNNISCMNITSFHVHHFFLMFLSNVLTFKAFRILQLMLIRHWNCFSDFPLNFLGTYRI